MIQSRGYRGEEDYARLRELLMESYAISGRMHNWGIDCLDWFRYCTKVFEEIENARRWERGVRLWETDANGLVAAMILDEGGEAFPQVHPHHRYVDGDMLDWAEGQHQAAKPQGAGSWPLSFFVYEYDRERQALLKERGYENRGQDSTMRWRPLDAPIPDVRLPLGYSMRSIDGEDQADLEKRAAIANNAFGIEKHTAQTIRTLQRAPTYRSELDLVVVGQDGTFASYCVARFDKTNRIGMIGPVGTHRAHWRRGLAKAVVSAGLGRLEALGATRAYVDCGLDPGANRLYEEAGFTHFDRLDHWQKAF